jgi:putative serine/threonine protein kinase
MPVTVPVENLKEEPYGSILCYPRATETELQKRIAELKELGVTAVEFEGKTSVFNVPVLGKGYVGLVVAARFRGQRVALKIRRVDADRSGLQHEADMLAKANTVNVGPKLISVSTNFLLMQLIDGDSLPDWLRIPKKKNDLPIILREVLDQCWRLDNIGLDHGELSHAPKHLIVDKHQNPWIVDFETASVNRKSANVTGVCQFLFTSNGAVARMVAEALGERNQENLLDALRAYKNNKKRDDFDRVLQACLS